MPLLSPSRILRAAGQHSNSVKWSETLALPRSTFPARPSATQLDQYRQRCADDLYAWQRANRPQTAPNENGKEVNNEFVLHDGPPYANGAVHVGHALNKVLKDLVLRWHLASGKRVQYTPGWDCHGLPIELKALQAWKTQTEQAAAPKDTPKQEEAAASGMGMSASEIRQVARTLATETIEKQKASFREWGIMGEWAQPYKTMDLAFEIKQLGVFKEMVRKGLISRHHRPVYWSPSSRTALAEAELEYDNSHKCTAAFVKMPFTRLPSILHEHPQLEGFHPMTIAALIWTTTPWTLPANQAIAVNPEMKYAVVCFSMSENYYEDVRARQEEKEDDHPSRLAGELLLVARDRIEHVLSFLPKGTRATTVVDNVSGVDLIQPNSMLKTAANEGWVTDLDPACHNILSGGASPILLADWVTATSGTGLVHVAPGHGMDDYQLCQENNLLRSFNELDAPVDNEGKFTSYAFPPDSAVLEGLDVQTEGVEAVLRILTTPESYEDSFVDVEWRDLVLATHGFVHKNPIDWRTKQPVIVRATPQWFADVSAIKKRALAALDGVNFIPDGGKTRLKSFIEGRSQWCISRQRAWGVPIPVLYHKETDEACIREESIEHIISVIEKRGTDAWFSDPPDEAAWIHPSLSKDLWVRGNDTMDVWFDSGTTWMTLENPGRDGQHVSDLYLEGTDQHRGWFQSSLLTSIATQDSASDPRAPFKELVTHGFTLDAEGKKMSKSLGNVISPDQILDGSLLPPLKARKQRGKGKNSAQETVRPNYDAMGPDALRLWVASSDYTRDVSISIPVLQSVQQALQKYRVTFKFLLGVLADYQPELASLDPHTINRDAEDYAFADRAVLLQAVKASVSVRDAYREYQFYKAVNEINAFVNADLSAFYFENIKDTMYAGSNVKRKRTQAVLKVILDELLKMLGPITPHLVEEAWEHRPDGMRDEVHPLRRVWVSAESSSDAGLGMFHEESAAIEQGLDIFHELSAAVKLAQEQARTAGHLGSGLACKVEVHMTEEAPSTTARFVKAWYDSGEMADLLVVSQVALISGTGHGSDRPSPTAAAWRCEQPFKMSDAAGTGRVIVMPPDLQKCIRCWKYTAEDVKVPCMRCQGVLREKHYPITENNA